LETLSLDEVARQAGVEEDFVHRPVSLGAISYPTEHRAAAREVRRVRLLHAWDRAGIAPETIFGLIEQGALSLAFLDSASIFPGTEDLDRSEETYADLCAELNVSFELASGIQEALGFSPPGSGDRARVDDEKLIRLAKLFTEVGASEDAILRLYRVYANSLRRMAQAEAELFEAQIEGKFRSAGMTERQLMDFGNTFGERVRGLLEGSLLAVYRRHRQHIWIEHSTNHAEVALQQAGLRPQTQRLHTICFVDLTGYTRVTEERGDEVAARLAGELSSLVEDISFRRDGRPIRWLGDGGMFLFREAAVFAALEMNERAPEVGLPPTHIGIHSGPVVFQDGDVYGRTVNLASRIASQAKAGQVLVSSSIKEVVDETVSFRPTGEFRLKNVSEPVVLFEASRRPG
jgi:adenylate cyclase